MTALQRERCVKELWNCRRIERKRELSEKTLKRERVAWKSRELTVCQKMGGKHTTLGHVIKLILQTI